MESVTEIELAMKHNKPIHFYAMDEAGLDFKEIVNMDDLKFEREDCRSYHIMIIANGLRII